MRTLLKILKWEGIVILSLIALYFIIRWTGLLETRSEEFSAFLHQIAVLL